MLGWLLKLADGARHRARLKRGPTDQAYGWRGEDLAHRYLERQGLTVVARNHRPASGAGEIDLVAWDRDTLAFVEVKCRNSDQYSPPDRNVDAAKRRALVSAARSYARQAGIPWERVRFDVISVVLADPPRLTHLRDAIRPPASI